MKYSWMMFVAMVCWGGSLAFAEPLKAPQRTQSEAGDGSYTIEKEAPADEVRIMGSRDISLASDEKLVDAYIDTVVELEATKTFHVTSGFTPKEYKRYKALLKYRVQLLFEARRRKIDVPLPTN